MNQITWTETELEKESGAFFKAASSQSGRIININNGVASVAGMNYSTVSALFQKLIKTGCIKPYGTGYVVTDFGVISNSSMPASRRTSRCVAFRRVAGGGSSEKEAA